MIRMKSATNGRSLGLLVAVLAGLTILACTEAEDGSVAAPIVAVDMGQGHLVCVYEGAQAPAGQKCDARAAKYSEVSQAPSTVQSLVKAIQHAAVMGAAVGNYLTFAR